MAGRPSSYKPEYAAKLIEHMEKGLSFESFGGVARCCKQTLYSWAEKHEDFRYAKALGESLSLLWWEKTGHEGLFMGGKENPFNATIWIVNMKNRFQWRDKPKDEDSYKGGDGMPGRPVAMTPEALIALVQTASGRKKDEKKE